MVDEEPEEDRKPLLEPPAAAASGSAASCGWLRGKVTPLCAAKWTVILASLAGMCYLWQSGLLRQLLASGQACAAWMGRHPWSLAAFLVVNALLEASLVVSSVSKMVQPFLPVSFGFVLGPAFLLVANFTASLACFVNGRFAVRKWVLRHAGHLRLFRAVDRALAQDASILYVLRLSPLNDAAVSYLLAVTHVPWEQYARGSAVEAAKRTVEVCYVGYLLSLGLSTEEQASQPGAIAIAVGGLLLIVVGSVLVNRRVKAELAVLPEHAHDGLNSPSSRMQRSFRAVQMLQRMSPRSGCSTA